MLNTIYNENAKTGLFKLPAGIARTCVTSPPYYGLRDYGHPDQIGLEETPEQYIANLVEVFRGVKHALANDGTLWVNIGDSYWGGKGQNNYAWSASMEGKRKTLNKSHHNIMASAGEIRPTDRKHCEIKPKDLIGIPWMLAFALRADGWYLRQDIIWHKPNPMPESVTDRCTKSHEYIFLLSKSERYFYDNEAISEMSKNAFIGKSCEERKTGGEPNRHGLKSAAAVGARGFFTSERINKRSVWTVSTKPYSEAHFATFPPDLITPCIQAGSAIGDTVLDPFMGSGTTAEVALRLDRQYVGFEINPDYIAISNKRLNSHKNNLFTP